MQRPRLRSVQRDAFVLYHLRHTVPVPSSIQSPMDRRLYLATYFYFGVYIFVCTWPQTVDVPLPLPIPLVLVLPLLLCIAQLYTYIRTYTRPYLHYIYIYISFSTGAKHTDQLVCTSFSPIWNKNIVRFDYYTYNIQYNSVHAVRKYLIPI